MSGIDRKTGRVLNGFDHVVQSLEVIFSVPFGSLPLQRDFGLSWYNILGKLAKREEILRFWVLIASVMSVEEPRFKIERFVSKNNNVDTFRQGELSFIMEGTYRPRAHLGDFTPEGAYQVGLGKSGIQMMRG